MHNNSRKGVTNIVLMLGVAISIGVLLIGGFLIVTKFIQAQAKASPEYVTTELTTLINTVQVAPESVTFEYYTDTDENGFPVIGSLEIDDNKNILCVHPHSENEIMASITEQASIAAGFGGTAYAINRVRSAVGRRAASKPVLVGVALSGLNINKKLQAELGSSSIVGKTLRKQLSGEKLNKYEGRLLNSYFKRNPTTLKSNYISLAKSAKSNSAIRDIFKATRFTSFAEKLGAKIIPRKLSKFGASVQAYFAKWGETRAGKIVFGKLKINKIPSGILKGKLVAGFAIGTFILTGGDWSQTIGYTAFIIVGKYVPKLVQKLFVKKIGQNFMAWLARRVPFSVGANTAYKLGMECATKTPPPVSVGCAAVGAVAKAVEVGLNIGFTVYNTVLLDVFLVGVRNGAGAQVAQERSIMACTTFMVPQGEQVLLTPPNCQPTVTYGGDFDTWRQVMAGYFVPAGITLFGASAWAAATAYTPSAADIPQMALYAGSTIAVGVPIGLMVARLSQGVGDMIPIIGCKANQDMPSTNTCDTTYLRQDCPNWYISDAGLGTATAGGTFTLLLNGGVACAALAITGSAGFICDAARVSTALGTFFGFTAEVFNFMLQGNEVGFNKPSIGAKSALGSTENIFSDNEGFWYAEFPYTIELTKVYSNSSTAADRHAPLIIRKV